MAGQAGVSLHALVGCTTLLLMKVALAVQEEQAGQGLELEALEG